MKALTEFKETLKDEYGLAKEAGFNLLNDRKGTVMATQVIGVVIVVVLLAVGAVIAFSIVNNIDRSGFSTAANTTLTNLETQTQSAWAIGNLLPLIGFAVAAIGAVIGILAWVRTR